MATRLLHSHGGKHTTQRGIWRSGLNRKGAIQLRNMNVQELNDIVNELAIPIETSPRIPKLAALRLEMLVRTNDCANLNRHLQAHADLVDADVMGAAWPARFTGLELALWNSDWRLLALFFARGADPARNRFDGVARIERPYRPYGYTGMSIDMNMAFDDEAPDEVMAGFDADGPQPVPGFAGLRLLLKADGRAGREGKAYLHLMEYLRSDAMTLRRDYKALAESVDAVSRDLRYTAADLKELVRSSLLTLQRRGLPREVAFPIVEAAARDTLWLKVDAFAARPRIHFTRR